MIQILKWRGGLWIVFCVLEKKFPGLEKMIKCCLPIYFVVFGIALFVVSHCLRSIPITDYKNVYDTAYQLAMGEEVTNWVYFAQWSNNIGCMLGLALLFLPGRWLPEQFDVYYCALFVNVLLLVLFVYCIYYLVTHVIKGHPVAIPLMTLSVCALWIPFWANMSIFYSDQMSLVWGMFGVTLLYYARQKEKGTLYYLAAGVLFGVGIIFKVTSGIIVIAVAIACLLFTGLWKERFRFLVTLAGCFGILLLFNVYCKTLPYQEYSEDVKAPVEYWFAIGLVGTGTYADNEEFAHACLFADTFEERTRIARQQIIDEIDNLWDLDHVIAKTRQNFGVGDLGAGGYLHIPVKENFLWNCFSMNGQYFWRYACITTSLFFAVLFYMGIAGLKEFRKKPEEAEEELIMFVAALAVWGICLFMMLWEAQDKFLYNHSGWMILVLIYSVSMLGRKKDITNERKSD